MKERVVGIDRKARNWIRLVCCVLRQFGWRRVVAFRPHRTLPIEASNFAPAKIYIDRTVRQASCLLEPSCVSWRASCRGRSFGFAIRYQ